MSTSFGRHMPGPRQWGVVVVCPPPNPTHSLNSLRHNFDQNSEKINFEVWEQCPDVKLISSSEEKWSLQMPIISVKGRRGVRSWSEFSLSHLQAISWNRFELLPIRSSEKKSSEVWLILTCYLTRKPIVCRYAMAVLGIWLGSSALLFLAR